MSTEKIKENTEGLTMADISPFEDDKQLIVVKKDNGVEEQETLVTDSWVFVKNNKALTTSLKVAEVFGKEHFNVVRNIRDLIKEMASVSNAFNFEGVKMFAESTYTDAKGERRPMFLMNRDGLTLLSMGFTGKKALQFKLAYIAAFNKMEALLKKGAPLSQEVFEAILKKYEERITILEDKIKIVEGVPTALEKMAALISALTDKVDQINKPKLPKRDLTGDIKKLIQLCVDKKGISHSKAYYYFYRAISIKAGLKPEFVQEEVFRQRQALFTAGLSEKTANQRVTGLTVINNDDVLRETVLNSLTKMLFSFLD